MTGGRVAEVLQEPERGCKSSSLPSSCNSQKRSRSQRDNATACCKGACQCSPTTDQAPSNRTGTSTQRVTKFKIRWGPVETTRETPHSKPAYQGRFAMDERSKAPIAATRLPPLKPKPAAAATSHSTSTSATHSERSASLARSF